MSDSSQFRSIALGLLGAVAGGCIGYFAFFWLVRQGFYGLLLPAACLGWGAGKCAGRRSTPLAAVCAVAGLALGLFTEWKFAPFAADAGLPYFVTHIHELRPITLILIALGTYLSYRLALGHDSNDAAVR